MTEKEFEKWVTESIDFLAGIMATKGRQSKDFKEWRDSFVKDIQAQEREQMVGEIEGMKQKLFPEGNRSKAEVKREKQMVGWYNTAIKDILAKLKQEEK